MDEITIKINIMKDMMEKKLSLLKETKEITKKQKTYIFESEKDFQQAVQQKQTLIDEILKIDHIFERMFEDIKDKYEDKHRKSLLDLKNLVKEVLDTDTSIRVLEDVNKSTCHMNYKKIELPKANQGIASDAYLKHKKN